MSTPFNQSVTRNVANDFSCQFSDSIYDATITSAGGAQTLTIPATGGIGASSTTANKYLAVIKVAPTKTVVVSKNATAVVNGTTTFGATGSELVRDTIARQVKAGDTLSFLTTDTSAYVSVILYSIT